MPRSRSPERVEKFPDLELLRHDIRISTDLDLKRAEKSVAVQQKLRRQRVILSDGGAGPRIKRVEIGSWHPI